MRTKEEIEDLELREKALDAALKIAERDLQLDAANVIQAAKLIEAYLRGDIPKAEKREAKA